MDLRENEPGPEEDGVEPDAGGEEGDECAQEPRREGAEEGYYEGAGSGGWDGGVVHVGSMDRHLGGVSLDAGAWKDLLAYTL